MRYLVRVLSLSVCILGLSACTQSEVYVTEESSPSQPILKDFYVVDSDGYRSNYVPNYESVIDPNVDNGLFEVYWHANSFYDYRVTFSINDRPSMAGSFILSEEYCGAGLSCDYDGMQICQYTRDGFLGCGSDLHDVDHNLTSIEPMLVHLPEYLFLNIEICDKDGFHCVVDSQEVSLY